MLWMFFLTTIIRLKLFRLSFWSCVMVFHFKVWQFVFGKILLFVSLRCVVLIYADSNLFNFDTKISKNGNNMRNKVCLYINKKWEKCKKSCETVALLCAGITTFNPDVEFCAAYKYKSSIKLTYAVTERDNTWDHSLAKPNINIYYRPDNTWAIFSHTKYQHLFLPRQHVSTL